VQQGHGRATAPESRVLNGRSDVAAHTRERVEQLPRAHGYQRRGSRPRARLIDLVFNDLDSPWALEIIRGVEDAAHSEGVGTVVSAIHRRASATREWLENIAARASDGAILVTTDLDPALHWELRELQVPTVVIDPAGVPSLDVPTIGAANWAGGVSATEHLTAWGTGASVSSPAPPPSGAPAPASTATGRA
jgi:LacI family transcriptional regulator